MTIINKMDFRELQILVEGCDEEYTEYKSEGYVEKILSQIQKKNELDDSYWLYSTSITEIDKIINDNPDNLEKIKIYSKLRESLVREGINYLEDKYVELKRDEYYKELLMVSLKIGLYEHIIISGRVKERIKDIQQKIDAILTRIYSFAEVIGDSNLSSDDISAMNKEVIKECRFILTNLEIYSDYERCLMVLNNFINIKSPIELYDLFHSILEKLRPNLEENQYYIYKYELYTKFEQDEEYVLFYDMYIKNSATKIEEPILESLAIAYLFSLYKLNRYKKCNDLINQFSFSKEKYVALSQNIKLNIAIINGDSNKIEEVITNLSKYTNKFIDNIKLKAINALRDIIDADSYKADIYAEYIKFLVKYQDEYVNILKDGNCKGININGSYSNIVIKNLKAEDEPTKLYHYTSSIAMKSILENKVFWVTAAEFLNDTQETKHIRDIVKEIKDENEVINKVHSGVEYYFNNQIECDEYIKKYIDNVLRSDLKDTYILSLSKNKDSLSLWGNYSDNEGYNLGIDNKMFKKQFVRMEPYKEPQFTEYFSGSVLYLNSEDRDILCSIKTFIDDCKSAGIKNEIIVCSIITSLINLGLFIKKKAFQTEEEYRIVFTRAEYDKNVGFKNNFRVKDGAFIPYIEIPIDKGAIKEINIGPNNKVDFTKKGLELLLKHNGFDNVEINKSDIPLRY